MGGGGGSNGSTCETAEAADVHARAHTHRREDTHIIYAGSTLSNWQKLRSLGASSYLPPCFIYFYTIYIRSSYNELYDYNNY